jgi:hypothetical protein
VTTQLMTLREAAAFLGWTGRWAWRRVLRKLKAIEKRTGRTVLVRGEGIVNGTRYHVSRGALLQHLPALWVTNHELRRSISSEMRKYREEVRELKDRVEDVELKLVACAEAIGRS